MPNIVCFQTQKQLPTLNNIQVLLKSVLIDLRGGNFVHAKTSLRARLSLCVQFVEPCKRKKIIVQKRREKYDCSEWVKLLSTGHYKYLTLADFHINSTNY